MMTMDLPADVPGADRAVRLDRPARGGCAEHGVPPLISRTFGGAPGSERTSPFRPRDFRVHSVIAKADAVGLPVDADLAADLAAPEAQSVQRTLLNSILRKSARSRGPVEVASPPPPRPGTPFSPECSSCLGPASSSESETSHSLPQLRTIPPFPGLDLPHDGHLWPPYPLADVARFPFGPYGHHFQRVPSPSPTSTASSPGDLYCEAPFARPRLLGLPWAALSPSLAQPHPANVSSALKFGVDRILSEDVSPSAASARRNCISGLSAAGYSDLCTRGRPQDLALLRAPIGPMGAPLGGALVGPLGGALAYTALLAPTPLRAFTRAAGPSISADGLVQGGPGGPGAVPGSGGGSAGGAGVGAGPAGTKRKRSWSRAVFSNLQRKGLEKRFQLQKYITKPDRRQLAATLGLTDAQVKVWFQNRRMKWRHSKESKNQQRSNTVTTRAEESHELRRPDSTQDHT